MGTVLFFAALKSMLLSETMTKSVYMSVLCVCVCVNVLCVCVCGSVFVFLSLSAG